MEKKEKLTYKQWNELDFSQQCTASKRLVEKQKPQNCKYGYNSQDELVCILYYNVLPDVFTIS